MDYENHLEKKSDKTKNQRQNAACEKTIREKVNFCSKTLCSLYFENWRKKISPQNHFFRSTSSFGATKSLLQFDFKNHDNCEQIFNKDRSPIQFKFSVL